MNSSASTWLTPSRVHKTYLHLQGEDMRWVPVRKEGTTVAAYADPFAQTCAPSTISDNFMSFYFTMQRLRGT